MATLTSAGLAAASMGVPKAQAATAFASYTGTRTPTNGSSFFPGGARM
jgi:hypothetical protein